MIAVSTGWRSGRIRNGERLLDALAEVGAREIELEYRMSERMLRQMSGRLGMGDIRVSSVHNFFPIPRVLPPRLPGGDVFNFAATDERERKLAVRFGIRSMKKAAQLGAKAVVFHMNKVPMPNGTRELKAFYDRGALDSPEAGRLRAELLAARRKGAREPFDRVLASIEDLAEAAREIGVLVGLENRYHRTEIPDFEEFVAIFERFPDAPVAYWHDIGHAFVQDRFGFGSHLKLLESFGSRMAGIHVHDVVGYDDHWAPGTGEVDFSEIAPHVPLRAIRVLEAHSKVSSRELAESMSFVRRVGLACHDMCGGTGERGRGDRAAGRGP
ncbi:MAG: sugar phosphate isomerase/epimerase [Actinobacteria bacterium]|nr:MAG: sugar phosphate isomerase/epimerase [Actinomycetota bacterium]